MAVFSRSFCSLSRELRDHIYDYWWTDEWTAITFNDSQIIPFEDADREPNHYAASGWRVNRKLLNFETLVLNKQVHDELLESFLPGLHLVLSGFYFAIDEDMTVLDFYDLRVPLSIFENASQIDFRLELVPRHKFFTAHTVESQFETLRSVGVNRYMGNSQQDQYARGCNQYAKDKFGARSVELRTPARAYSRFDEKLRERYVTSHPEPPGPDRPFELRDISDYNRTLFIKGLDAGLISQDAVLERIEALRAVHGVGLPLPKGFYDFFDSGDHAAVLWEDFVLGARPLVFCLEGILERAVYLERFRLILRTREPLLSRKSVLGNIMNALPDLTSLRALESVSVAATTPLPFPNPRSLRVYEQWTSGEGVQRLKGFPLEELCQEALAPSPLPPSMYVHRADSDGGLMQGLETESQYIAPKDIWSVFNKVFDWPELKPARREQGEQREAGGGVAERLAEVIEQRDPGEPTQSGPRSEEPEDAKITELRRLDAEAEGNEWRNLRVFEGFY